ncbi:MAG TPA: LD-carboxypeptidase [Gemmatimonadales bacterium]|nr:LD-carboxypeptidase [Gemmatimonadales bacterium]
MRSPTSAVLPPRLGPGTRVALVAPAGPLLEHDELVRATALAEALGLTPRLGAHAARRHGYLAGTDEERALDLQTALSDPEIDAVWCLRGGYGVTRILDRIDFAPLRARPKAIVGFSDITALLLAAGASAGIVTFHGPVARQPMSAFSRRGFERVLFRGEPAGPLEALPPPSDVLVPTTNRIVTIRGGTAEGPLAGGNLTLLHCLVGTPWFPALDGAILFLEDVSEKLYAVDRMLAHLRTIGALSRLAGVAIGRFTDLDRNAGDGALGFDEVLTTYFGPLGIPVVAGLPIGHIEDQWTLPLGVRTRLDASRGELAILEPAVR